MSHAVKIILTHGHFFVTQGGTEYEAKCFVRDWHSGALALRGDKHLGDPDKGWSVRVDQIVAMHVIKLEVQQPQNPYAAQPHARPGSGYFPN